MRPIRSFLRLRPRGRPAKLALTPPLVLALLFHGAASAPGVAAASESTNRVGVACTTDASPNPTFTLTTKSGYVGLPDGASAFMWGYSEGSRPFQHPGPVLCVNEGDTVTVVLKNTLNVDTSIAFPGQTGVTANGAPVQPQFNGAGVMTSLVNVATANGGTMTYSFVASAPGTYLYESGTNVPIQVRMGLFGALIVRPSMGASYAYDRADSRFNPNTEFLALLSEIDPYLNAAVEKGRAFNLNNYKPRYWLINGRGYPDSVADNFASWLPGQPYGSLAQIQPLDPVKNPYPSLTRYLNVGTEDYPFHPHGNNGTVIGRDGRPLANAGGDDLSFEKFAINIGPGQTWDVLFSWKDTEHYSSANPAPVTEPLLQDLQVGVYYSGSGYLGETQAMPPGVTTLNECGEFYIIAHNHALYQITSWGVTMTGPITYTRVDPPNNPNCGK